MVNARSHRITERDRSDHVISNGLSSKQGQSRSWERAPRPSLVTSLCNARLIHISPITMSSSRPHPLPAPVVHAGFAVSQSKSYVLAGVQDAYWSDDEAVGNPSIEIYSFFLPHLAILGGCRMPSVLGRNGYIRSQLQTLHLWLSGSESFFVTPRIFEVRFPDMPFLLASYQGKPEQTLPCLSPCLLR